MRTPILVIAALGVLVGCGGDDSNNDADAGFDAEIRDAGVRKIDAWRPPPAGSCDVTRTTPTTEIGGPCVEGMQCSGIVLPSNAGNMLCADEPYAPCTCVAGIWQCADAGDRVVSLPTRDPQTCEGCVWTNLACTLPDVCGGLCTCDGEEWRCGTVDGGGGDSESSDSDSGEGGDGGEAGAGCPVAACSVLPPADGVGDGGCFPVSCDSIDSCKCLPLRPH